MQLDDAMNNTIATREEEQLCLGRKPAESPKKVIMIEDTHVGI